MSTQYTKEQLMEFFEQLFMETYHANNKLKLSMYVHNKFVDHSELTEIAPSFFVLALDSLDNDVIIRIAKLFDDHRGSYGTLFKLLNLIEANTHLFPVENKLILSKINEHRKVFDEKKGLLQNLKTWRDKGYAHSDKNYFFNEDRLKLGESFPMYLGDLLDLLKISADIINYYSEKLHRIHHSFDNPDITKDVDSLFDILNAHISE